MHRSRGAKGYVAFLVLLVCLGVPGVALAQDSSYEGTYVVSGDGTSRKGTPGESAVTVWVEDLGSEARFTFTIDKMTLTTSATGPEQWDGPDKVSVPLDVQNAAVDANGAVTLVREGDTWSISGTGDGKALRYDGTGNISGQRASAGFLMPPIGEQITDMVSAITSGPPETGAAVDTASLSADNPLPGSPATPEPPLTDVEIWLAGGSLLLFLFAMLLFL